MYKEDFILKEIHKAIRFLVLLIFNKKEVKIDEILYRESPEYNMFFARIKDLVNSGEISEAEDLIFENYDKDNLIYLEIGLWFYDEINYLSDDKLEEMNFSRAEIKEGLKDLLQFYGYDMPNIVGDC